MSLKQEIETWVEALNHYDEQRFDEALEVFEANADTSKIYFNIGMIYATLRDHVRAVQAYQQATKLDQFLAVAYFQQGVSNFLLAEYREALVSFNEALLYLRGNTLIDYEQLGLKFRLYSCEVLFNRGLCSIYDGNIDEGMNDLEYASKEIQVEDHNVIIDAIAEQAEGYTVFSVPIGIVYRPNEAKVRNVKAKDYLGKARLVAAADRADAFTGFTGSEVKRMQDAANEVSWAATNLVKADLLQNRQSVHILPPNLQKDSTAAAFPPTPPPEKDPNKHLRSSTSASVRSSSTRRTSDLRGRHRDDPRDIDRDRDQDEYSPPRRRPTMLEQALRRAPSASSSRRDLSRCGTATSRRRPHERIGEHSDGEEQYEDDGYDYYDREPQRRGYSVRRGLSRRAASRANRYDDDEDASDGYEGSSFDEDEFEMLDNRSMRSGGSRRYPEIRKIKVKCHNGDDTRMLMIDTTVVFHELIRRLQDKFGYEKKIRCKVRDDDDGDGMIGLADQEDLDMVVSTAKQNARRERSDFGKMEVWVFQV